MQKLLIVAGLISLAIGFLWPVLEKGGLGRLPGDLLVEGENYKFYFPIVTCIFASALLSAAFWFLNKWW